VKIKIKIRALLGQQYAYGRLFQALKNTYQE